MEVRVAELEQENAALRALTQKGNNTSPHPKKGRSDEDLLAEIEELRAQLAAAGERELELSAELERQAESGQAAIKTENSDPQFPPSPIPRTALLPLHKSGASLGLMVLLCALPTLLSMPTHHSFPTSFSLPITGPSSLPVSSTFDFNSMIPNDYDWLQSGDGTTMDLDVDTQGRVTTSNRSNGSTTRRLQFVDAESEALGLGDLDISFDISPSDHKSIRVKIHPSSSQGLSSSHSPRPESRRRSISSSSLAMWAGTQSDPNYGTSYNAPTFSAFPPLSSSTSDCDPFFGVNSSFGLGSPMSVPMMGEFPLANSGQHSLYSLGSDYTTGTGHVGEKRRVRIALKSMPTAGGEGGEWEVEVR